MTNRRGAVAGPAERLPTDAASPWWGEHRSRYRFALNAGVSGVILDIACGSGFGSAMLADRGEQVVGCDVEPSAATDASARHGNSRLSFMACDGTRMPFADGSFDTVVSFETIEHVAAADAFLREIHRILRPDGVLVLSTPNLDVTSSYPANPFHVREYSAPELRALLSAVFGRVDIVGQNLAPPRRVAPFLPGHDVARTFADGVSLLAWKAGHRLPPAVRDRLARAAHGRGFYPAEDEFEFTPNLDRAHVLVATCRK